MTPEKIAELEAATAAAKAEAEAAGGTDETLNKKFTDAQAAETSAKAPSQTLETELDRAQKQGKKTEAEKAAFSLKQNAARLKELGGDPAEALGFTAAGAPATTEDDTRPMTVGEYKRMQEEGNTKTALELADQIADEKERELTKEYLKMFSPTVKPEEAVRVARMAVNSAKHGQIVEEIGRKIIPSAVSSAAGAPAKQTDNATIELTVAEIPFSKAPFNMTPAEIVAKRPKS